MFETPAAFRCGTYEYPLIGDIRAGTDGMTTFSRSEFYSIDSPVHLFLVSLCVLIGYSRAGSTAFGITATSSWFTRFSTRRAHIIRDVFSFLFFPVSIAIGRLKFFYFRFLFIFHISATTIYHKNLIIITRDSITEAHFRLAF